MQIPSSVAINLEDSDSKLPHNCSYEYCIVSDGVNVEWHEYQIDTHPCLEDYIKTENRHFGGNLSIRRDKNKKPLMMSGHDESTYHQFIFSKEHWKGPSGRNFILPKGL